MFELIDEIGREHVRVLRFVAQESSDVLVHVMVDGTLHKSGSFQLRGRDQRGMDAVLKDGVRPLDVYQVVFDVLVAHGMLVVEAIGDGVRNEAITEKRKTMPVVLNLYRVRLSARGKDFLTRHLLACILSIFSAKANKWIAYAMAAIGVFGGTLTVVKTTANLVSVLSRLFQ